MPLKPAPHKMGHHLSAYWGHIQTATAMTANDGSPNRNTTVEMLQKGTRLLGPFCMAVQKLKTCVVDGVCCLVSCPEQLN